LILFGFLDTQVKPRFFLRAVVEITTHYI
jgi:hypothetical protein